ncbi:MAG TPA: hypothetical protein VGV37_06115 [Aliidongia sp.]|uniref:hypothetical protein n=1 Tax=Aliidongia sp. TaxID=1914230 RepID=UPI002DDD0630|nr:hypothetical protein [Aliidongia sp.]HEV2674099.1 hypothetical protein [Aliidongia sp.]
MTRATMKTVPRLYFACPSCGYDEAHEVTHFLANQRDTCAGPWQCEECGTVVNFLWSSENQTVEITSIVARPKPVNGYMLLRLAQKTESPVWFIVEHQIYTRDGPPESMEEWIEHQRYWVNEHTCPTNIIRVAAIIEGADTDPHGVVEFVAFAARPDEFDEDNADWPMLFPQLSGMEIEGDPTLQIGKEPKP